MSDARPLFVNPAHITTEPRQGYVQIRRTKGRSAVQNARYWSILSKVIESGACRFGSPETLHDAIKMELGFIDFRKKLNGEVYAIPKSVAFDKMSHSEFTEFNAKAMALISEHYLDGQDPETLFERNAA